MFFESAKDASLQARIETQVTGYTHQVVACQGYLSNIDRLKDKKRKINELKEK